MKRIVKNEKGFTLIEIIAVLILLGILAAVAVPKYIDLTVNAENRALDAGVAELNGRENLTWANAKLSTGGWTADALVDTDLGTDYSWSAAPTVAGGTLAFGNSTVVLTRTASITTSPGSWAGP